MINQTTGKYLIIAGITLLIASVVLCFFFDKLGWIGNLPGDIRIKNENSVIYIPFTSMLLFSALLNLVLFIVRKVI